MTGLAKKERYNNKGVEVSGEAIDHGWPKKIKAGVVLEGGSCGCNDHNIFPDSLIARSDWPRDKDPRVGTCVLKFAPCKRPYT